jgi:hypothetical protein
MIESLDHAKFYELFKTLPEDLQDALFAPETTEKIEGICARNKIEELEDFLINGIGDVYLGVLSPNDFFDALKKQLKGKTGIRQIILEINNFLLFPYKDSIEKIYHLQCVPPASAPAAPAAAADQTAAPANAAQPAQTASPPQTPSV